jgi:hypothetical protein
MSGVLVPQRGLGLTLAATAAILAALAVWPFVAPHSRPPLRPPAARPAAAADTAHLPPFAAFAAVAERPLFAPSRRPANAAAGALLGNGLAARYRLLGIIADGGSRHAWLAKRLAAGAPSFEIGEGDTLEGWTVRRIGEDRLILASPAGETALVLHAPPEGAVPAPPQIRAPPPAPRR